MFASKKILIAAALVLTVAASGPAVAHEPVVRVQYVYASYRHGHVARLARHLETDARILTDEARLHFRLSPSYRVFETHVEEMLRLSDCIYRGARTGRKLFSRDPYSLLTYAGMDAT